MEDEFDSNGNSIVLIACKHKLYEKIIIKLVDKKSNFRELNLDYVDYKIYCGLGSFSFYLELKDQAKEKEFAILKQKGTINSK